MPRADAAEWVLSLATSQERAASVVGDFLEESASRGPVWFWITLIWTATSLVWHTWTAAPLRMAGLAFGAWFLNGVLSITFFFALLAGSSVVGTWMKSYDLHVNVDNIASWVALWATLPFQCLTGRWLARRAPGRELAVCAAYLGVDIVVWITFWTAATIAWPSVAQEQQLDLTDLLLAPLTTILSGVVLFVGVEQIRRKSAAAQPASKLGNGN